MLAAIEEGEEAGVATTPQQSQDARKAAPSTKAKTACVVHLHARKVPAHAPPIEAPDSRESGVDGGGRSGKKRKRPSLTEEANRSAKEMECVETVGRWATRGALASQRRERAADVVLRDSSSTATQSAAADDEETETDDDFMPAKTTKVWRLSQMHAAG